MKSSRILVFLLFIFFFQIAAAQKDSSDMQFDIGWTRDKDMNLWPLLKYKRDTTAGFLQTDIFFSDYRFRRNRANAEKYSHLFPLWRKKDNVNEKDFRLLTLYYPTIFHYRNDKQLGIKSFNFIEFAPEISAIGFSKSADGLYVDNNLLFLLWYQRNDANKSSFLIFFPIYWAFENPQKNTHTFFPLFSFGSYDYGTSKYAVVTPFFWHIKKSNEKSNVIFPLFWNKKTTTENNVIRRNTLFPVVWTYNSRNENRFTLFPVVFSRKNQYRKSLVIFPVAAHSQSADGYSSFTAVTPLYWHFRKNQNRSDILFPVFWSFRKNDSINTFRRTILFPVWFSYKDKYKKQQVFFPLIWNYKNPDSHTFTFFPIFSTGKQTSANRKYTMITPLFWHTQKYSEKTDVLFPLFWSIRDNDSLYWSRKQVFFPLWYSFSDNYHKTKVFFPLLWSYRNQQYRSLTVLPFFSYGTDRAHNRTHFAVTPFFWHFQDSTRILNTVFPLFWDKKVISKYQLPSRRTVLFPVFFKYHDTNKNRLVIFPVLWKFKNETYHSFTLLPIFSYGKSTDSTRSHFAITAIYWHFKQNNNSRHILFPLWWYHKYQESDGEHFSNVIFPVFWSYTNPDRSDNILFPLAWSLKNKTYQSFTFVPLFSFGHSTDGTREHITATPLFWYSKTGNEKSATLFPVVWIRNCEGTHAYRQTVVFPVWWSYRDSVTNNQIFFPLAWSINNPTYHSLTLMPFFSTGKSADGYRNHTAVTPLFWHFRKGNENTSVLFPLVWIKKRTGYKGYNRTTVFPVWWSYRDTTQTQRILFPIFWSFKNTEYKSTTVFPLISIGKNSDGQHQHIMVTPLFWHWKNGDETRTVLFPLLWIKKHEGSSASSRTTVFPIWTSYSDNGRKNRILFPIWWSFRNQNYHSLTLFPLFSTGKSPDLSHRYLVLTPLFWKFKNNTEHSTVFFPVFDSHTDGNGNRNFGILYFLFRYKKEGERKRADFLWPLCQYKSEPNLRYFRLVPLIWYKKSATMQFFSIQPFYYQYKKTGFSDYHFLWQVFTHKDIEGRKKTWNFLWKIVYYEKYAQGGHEFRFLYLLFADVKTDSMTEKSLFPLYYYSKESNGNKSFSMLLYFYNSFSRRLPGSAEFYKEEKIFWFIRLRSNYKKLKAEGKI